MEAPFIADHEQLRSLAATLPLTDELISGLSYNGAAPELKVDGRLPISAATENNDRARVLILAGEASTPKRASRHLVLGR